jgi:hypothetical protein
MRHERHTGENSLRPSFHLNTISSAARTTLRWAEHPPDQQPSEQGGQISSPLRQIKNPQGLSETLRIAPASSSSPVPQPSREQRSTFRAGLLARGSTYSPRLPIRSVSRETRVVSWRSASLTPCASPFTLQNSGHHGFRPHSQRRDREGFAPSSLPRKSQYSPDNRREGQILSSPIMSDVAHSVQPLCRRGARLDVKLEVEQGV